MKKVTKMLTGVLTAGLIASTVGCTQIKNWIKDNPESIEQIYTYTMDKAFDLLDKAANNKLEDLLKQSKITQAEYDVLVNRLGQSETQLRKLIEDLYAKQKASNETTPAQTVAEAKVAAAKKPEKKSVLDVFKKGSKKEAKK